MATLGEHLQDATTAASDLMARIESEPLNVIDLLESTWYKDIKNYINDLKARTRQ